MLYSVKQPAITTTAVFNGVRSPSLNRRSSLCLPSLKTLKGSTSQQLKASAFCCLSKPLHVSQSVDFYSKSEKPRSPPITTCKAADSSSSSIEVDPPKGGASRLKIGIFFASWWALNVVFNIYNKKVLNAFPYPWLTSTLSLACGSLIMLFFWITKIVQPPKTSLEFWKRLFPVAVAHTIGHVAATVSMSKVAVSFTHIIKSAEPAFSVIVSRFLLGENFPLPVYLSLIPIIGGCALSAATELNFNLTGFNGAMISNLAFVFRNIFSKKGMQGMAIDGLNYYGCLSILSFFLLLPFSFVMEGPQMWQTGWQTSLSTVGTPIIWWIAAQSIFYHLYNQVSYMSLDEISPLTFSVGNTMKRISVIVSSIIIFSTPVQPVNALGAAIAILGTFLYSQVDPFIIYISNEPNSEESHAAKQ
ncbi:hypothetical protein ACFE04_024104 [Oxalis oulophora]